MKKYLVFLALIVFAVFFCRPQTASANEDERAMVFKNDSGLTKTFVFLENDTCLGLFEIESVVCMYGFKYHWDTMFPNWENGIIIIDAPSPFEMEIIIIDGVPTFKFRDTLIEGQIKGLAK